MKIKQTNDNGNVIVFNRINQQETLNSSHFDNNTWLTTNNQANSFNTSNSQFHSNSNLHSESESFESDILTKKNDEVNVICNRQYRINSRNCKVNERDCDLESTRVISRLQGDTNEFIHSTISKEDQSFTLTHTNEMSEKGLQHMPRGIVNPNYPGFQHLAHTLQDYSSNIENFYQSENEMTDDDIDLDITESSYESEPIHNSESIRASLNNNNNETILQSTLLPSKGKLPKNSSLDSKPQNDIPDILKTIPINNNNNNNTQSIDFGCTDKDIENNFQKEDIIGDFNKEIEDEIKLLLNYNISIHDDLEELRKDIKETFTEPIENTINNISDVVNQVIKKLVETQTDFSDNQEINILDCQTVQDCIETFVMNKENEKNTRTEINLHRPSFLLIEDNINNKIADAFLSDGKDEINIDNTDYDTENLSRNVENTIKQLSTELRKIIPKLEEMREFDKLWTKKILLTTTIEKDGNSNEIASSNQDISVTSTTKTDDKTEFATNERAVLKNKPIETSSQKTLQTNTEPVKSSSCTAQRNPSVQKSDISKTDKIGSFDVYNIETALPKIDLDAIENHLRAAKEAERRKRNDREEIRKRLAMGIENDEYYSLNYPDRPGKKPSLQSRLQNGKNLQICFMNETASDNESQSDIEWSSSKNLSRSSLFSSKTSINHPYQTRPLSVSISKNDKISSVQSSAKLRPSSLSLRSKSRSSQSLGQIELKESDFYALQATLQTEARIALAQAKELARIQMERERRCRSVSPVTEMLRISMEKANAPLAPDRRRVSRQLLTDMNIAQLQVIVNELHSQIESLNDSLVKLLMGRDELHMGQDSMLVDIEDLTRYLGVKEQAKKSKGTSKLGVRRLASLVHK